MKKYFLFLKSLLRHKWYVLRAGRLTGVPLWRSLIHDWNKFTPSEFGRYARNFQGDYSKSPNDRDRVSLEFTLAWLHHENRSPHHWGYWIPRTGQSAGKPLPMPETHVREMIADFMGASKAYTDSWGIAAWLNRAGPEMRLHSDTVETISDVMHGAGYLLRERRGWSWISKRELMEIIED